MGKRSAVSAPARAGVVFDLDGTLVDSNYLHTHAWTRAFDDIGEWAPANAVHRLVGMGGDQLVPTLFGRDLPEARERRTQRYAELIGEVRPFPRAVELLDSLRAAGLIVALATSAPASELEVAVDRVGGRDRFDVVISADDVQRSKPDPEIIATAIQRASLDPARVIAVGDSVWDVRAARGAGVACIGVESGGFSRHELAEEGALAVYRDVTELCAQVWTSPLAVLTVRG